MGKRLAFIDKITLANHLSVAAEQYKRDAEAFRAEHAPDRDTTRLARHFDQQAKDCAAFADTLREGAMEVDGDLLLIVRG